MMENHKIVLSTEFVNDYSTSNTNSYEKGKEVKKAEPEKTDNSVKDEDKEVWCSKVEEDLSNCLRNYYETFLTENLESNEKDKSSELLKCCSHFKEYEPCAKKL